MTSVEKPKYWILNKKTKVYEPRKLYQFITDPENSNQKLVRKSVHDVVSTDPKWAEFYDEYYLNNGVWKMKVIDDKLYSKIEKTIRKNKTEKVEEKDEKTVKNVTKKKRVQRSSKG